ncbi:MAG: nitrate reductase molybdenum cofactor assembly chaperone [Sphingosinicella sp.]|uniref:nitrate reductase molybdenum cofactor assembly chaperone n=1 Tax=Sphingosinicella sp. TaxID=1917971 RepID=UPI004037A289
MITFKALGALLDYPTAELGQALPEIQQALAEERVLDAAAMDGVKTVIARLDAGDLLDLQEQWVGQFDRSKRLALHLYEHSHGESRDRGQAMVNLALAYRMYGFELASSETPDYLPLFLEFLSQVPDKVALHHLADATEILEALRVRLAERESTYAPLLTALVSLCRRSADEEVVEAILAGEPGDPEDLEALDREWAEEPVTFSPGAALGNCAYGRAGA